MPRWKVLFLLAACLTSFDQALYPSPGGLRERQPLDSASGGSPLAFLDHLHPEAFREPTWIEVDLPANDVALRRLRVLTANRSWSLRICESKVELSTCVTAVGAAGGGAVGWRGDFRDLQWTMQYRDRQGRMKLHLLVTPIGGDWMIFRIQVEVRR